MNIIKKIILIIIILGSTELVQATCTFSMDGKTVECINEEIWNTGPISKNNTIAENIIIKNTVNHSGANGGGAYGLYVASNFPNVTLENVDITTSGAQADGIMNRHSNPNGLLTIKNLRIVVTGSSADGINFGEENSAKQIIVGNDAYISSKQGSGIRINLALNTSVTSQITLGDRLTIITQGDASHREDVLGYGLFAGIRDRFCQRNIFYCTLGIDQWTYTNNTGNAVITVGNDSNISTTGSLAHAVYAMRGGDIALGNTNITTHNSNAYGLYAENLKDRGGKIYLLGSVKINVPNTGYAIKADGEGSFVASKSRVDSNGNSSPTGGIFDIKGNIGTSAGGEINLIAKNGSLFAGDLEATTTGITKLRMSGLSLMTGNLNSTDNGIVDLSLSESSSLVGKASKDSTGIVNLNLSSTNSNWYMTQDSLVTNLNAKGNGNIYLYGENNQLASSLPSYTGQTLIVDNLAGAGVFNFKTNIETTTTDFMVVNNDVMGTHRVEVQNDGAQKTTGEEILAIINTNNAVKDNAFYANRLVELGGYSYKFSRNSDNPEEWILSGSPKEEPEPSNPPKTVTSTGNAAASTIITTYLVNFIETQNLLKRMGQLNNSNVDSIGIWARAYTGNLSSFQGNLLKGFKMSYHTIQIGSDYFFPLDNAQMYIGGAVSYLDGSPRHDYYGKIGYIDDASKKSLIVGRGSSDGKIKSYSISLYGVYQNENHLYIDGLVKYSYMKNSFSVSDSAGLKVYGNDNSHAFSISAEIGQRFYFDSSKELGGYVTPQVQLVYSTFSAARYKATNGLVIKADKRGSLLGRIGVELGYKFAKNENTSGNIFTKFAYLREFSDDGAYWLNNSQEKYSFKGNWYQMEVGANVNFNKNHNIYGNLEFNKGNKFDQKQINIGYRYTF